MRGGGAPPPPERGGWRGGWRGGRGVERGRGEGWRGRGGGLRREWDEGRRARDWEQDDDQFRQRYIWFPKSVRSADCVLSDRYIVI